MASGEFALGPALHPNDADHYDSLDRYMPHAPDMGAATVPMGFFLAWCTNLRLLNPAFERAHERTILRVRMQEVVGSELLVAAGGDLSREMFSEHGNEFVARYYPEYLDDYKRVFDVTDESLCTVKETWDNYSKIAAVITPRLMGRKAKSDGVMSKLRKMLWR